MGKDVFHQEFSLVKNLKISYECVRVEFVCVCVCVRISYVCVRVEFVCVCVCVHLI